MAGSLEDPDPDPDPDPEDPEDPDREDPEDPEAPNPEAPNPDDGSRLACSRWAWAWRSSRDASRRSRSIARLRAVVMIQPAGLGGTPRAGQR
jgi:hypothetical protein